MKIKTEPSKAHHPSTVTISNVPENCFKSMEGIIVVWYFMFVQCTFSCSFRWLNESMAKKTNKKNVGIPKQKEQKKKIATWNCQRVIFWYIKVNMIRLHTNTKTPTVKLFSLFPAFHFDAALHALFFSLSLIFFSDIFHK